MISVLFTFLDVLKAIQDNFRYSLGKNKDFCLNNLGLPSRLYLHYLDNNHVPV
jgi:hypothetical protein